MMIENRKNKKNKTKRKGNTHMAAIVSGDPMRPRCNSKKALAVLDVAV